LVTQVRFTSDSRVVHAYDATGRTALEAVPRADARADIAFPPFPDLCHEIGVGDIRTGHPDEVHKAVRDRVSGGSDIVDLGGVQHGDVRMRTFHLGHGIEERCRLVAGTRYDLRQAGGRLDRPDDNVDE